MELQQRMPHMGVPKRHTVEAIFVKLHAVYPNLLPDATAASHDQLFLSPSVSHCAVCSVSLHVGGWQKTLCLHWVQGVIPVSFRVLCCHRCGGRYSSCWRYTGHGATLVQDYQRAEVLNDKPHALLTPLFGLRCELAGGSQFSLSFPSRTHACPSPALARLFCLDPCPPLCCAAVLRIRLRRAGCRHRHIRPRHLWALWMHECCDSAPWLWFTYGRLSMAWRECCCRCSPVLIASTFTTTSLRCGWCGRAAASSGLWLREPCSG